MAHSVAVQTLLIVAAALLAACGGDTPASPTPAPRGTTGVVQGIVWHESYLAGRITIPSGPLAGADVTVTEGPGAGATFRTGSDGAYTFTLASGPFRVRWTAPAYEPRESEAGAITAGATTTLSTVTLRLLSNVPIPEWSVSGLVLDGRGNPVPEAVVSIRRDLLTAFASATTDAAGRFRLISTRQHPDDLTITAGKSGYVGGNTSITCVASCAVAGVTIRMPRILREYLEGPSTMQVGDIAPISWIRERDDGTRDVFRAFVRSSNPGVVQVLRFEPPYERQYVKAVSAGTATLSLGNDLTLNVRVFQ